MRTQVRKRVLDRDGGCILSMHGCCAGPLDVDEIVSRGRGGSYLDEDNCQTLCRKHHDAKHSLVHHASIIGLWGDAAMRLHRSRELGNAYTLEDAEALAQHALASFLS